jgi:hypothetical protein
MSQVENKVVAKILSRAEVGLKKYGTTMAREDLSRLEWLKHAHLLIKEQHPNLDIRFLFQNANNKIRKGSKTTYAQWCEKNDIKWCEKIIPDTWLKENK